MRILAYCFVFLMGISGPAMARGLAVPIPDAAWEQMQGVSWHAGLGCPAREDLRLLIVPYTDFDGAAQRGQLIVAAEVAEDVLDIFAQLQADGFPIQSMILVHLFEGDDDLSMEANNTSAFNCRMTASGKRLSEHSYGRAIDINPVQNPYVTKSRVLPPLGADYDEKAERAVDHKGLIRKGDAVVKAFADKGWKWGGDWKSLKDYQHFSTSGR